MMKATFSFTGDLGAEARIVKYHGDARELYGPWIEKSDTELGRDTADRNEVDDDSAEAAPPPKVAQETVSGGVECAGRSGCPHGDLGPSFLVHRSFSPGFGCPICHFP